MNKGTSNVYSSYLAILRFVPALIRLASLYHGEFAARMLTATIVAASALSLAFGLYVRRCLPNVSPYAPVTFAQSKLRRRPEKLDWKRACLYTEFSNLLDTRRAAKGNLDLHIVSLSGGIMWQGQLTRRSPLLRDW